MSWVCGNQVLTPPSHWPEDTLVVPAGALPQQLIQTAGLKVITHGDLGLRHGAD
jgi:hypothetical protein